MKRILFSLLAMFAVGSLWAQKIIIPDAEVRKGGTGSIFIQVKYGVAEYLRGAQFDIILPEGITYNEGAAKMVTQQVGFQVTDHEVANQRYRFVITNLSGSKLVEGDMLELPISASANITGTTLIGTATGSTASDGSPKIALSGVDGSDSYTQDDFTFNIILTNEYILDERSTTAPTKANNVDVHVKRSLKAGKWNTICLPFAMTEDQVKEAFGSDVVLADFAGCKSTIEGSDITGLTLNFTTLSSVSIAMRHPYLIKISGTADIDYEEGFRVKGVNVNGTGTPTISAENGNFVGTYVSKLIGSEEEPVLYISDDKFYIAVGKSKLKAFRGYFELFDLIFYMDYIKETGAKIDLSVDGEATAIEGIDTNQRVVEGVYDLQGRKVMVKDGDINNLQRGLYIINGKKVAIK